MAEQTSKKSDSELVIWVHDQMKAASKASSSWRSDAEEDYAFYAGDQWSAEDAQLLKDQGRPPVVFNRAARTINAVAGLEVQNRQEVRYIPRETDDNSLADYYSAVVKWARDQTDAEDEDSEAFQDTLTCGMGWTQTRLDYDIDQEGMVEVGRFDPLEAFWDPASRKRNLVDAKWRARVKRYLTPDAVREIWPDYVESSNATNQAGDYLQDSHRVKDASPPHYDGANRTNQTNKPIEVVCFNWFELEPVYRVIQSDGALVFLPEDRFSVMKDEIEAAGLKYVRQKKRKFKIAYVCGSQLLGGGAVDAPSQSGFMFNCITGLRNRNENTWFGLMRLMIDPQRWANKFLVQIMHILNSNAKGGLLAEKDAFENPQKAEREWADPAAITLLRAGGMQKVQQKQMGQFPAGFQQLLVYAVEAVNDTPGVNSELLGLAERDQPAILEATRKQAGVTMLGIFFDSLRRYRKEQGRVLADLVRDFISDGRKIRIIGSTGKPEVVGLMKDRMAFTTDIVVDDAPNSPSMKDKVFTIMQTLVPQFAKLGFPVPPEILDYLPLPAAAIEKWKQMMEKNPQQQQMEQDAAMIAREEKVAQIEKDKAEAASKKADAEHKRAQTAQVMFEITPEGIAVKTNVELTKHAAEIQMKERVALAEIASKERIGTLEKAMVN